MKSRRIRMFALFVMILASMLTLSENRAYSEEHNEDSEVDPTDVSERLTQDSVDIVEEPYHVVLEEWLENAEDSTQFESAVSPSSFSEVSDEQIVSASDSNGYDEDVIRFENNQTVSFDVDVPQDGLYHLGFDYYRINDGLINPEFSIEVNDEFQYFESRRIVALTYWTNESNNFETNNYGNELVPTQISIEDWQFTTMDDPNNEQPEALRFFLTEGTNTITLNHASGSMLLGNVYVFSPGELLSYEEYSAQFSEGDNIEHLEVYEAERPAYKNSSYIRPIARKDINVVPYDASALLLNSFGGESWSNGGQNVTYQITVPETGLYHLTFKTLQNEKQNVPVFRNIEINGEIPFEEFRHYLMPPSNEWTNHTLSDNNGEPFSLHLESGENLITLEADITPLTPLVNTLTDIMQEINGLGLSISQLTGNQPDRNRDWVISDYLPDIDDVFSQWITVLEDHGDQLNLLYGGSDVLTTDEVSLDLIVQRLRTLRGEPDQLPNRLSELSEGTNSATQMIGDLITELQNSPLLIDRFYVHDHNANLPDATEGWFTVLGSKIQEFFLSFGTETYDITSTDENVLEIWVGRSQQYVELMQNMADASFTTETGIEVRLSVMPNEQKLILANSSNQQPDVALGVSVGQPWELAVRGAAADLKKFDDFEEFSTNFSPGAFLPMMVDDAVYAMPETQDFYVMFYRSDIMSHLDIPIPDTWNDVTAILPELQRYGMNFYVPLSGTAGTKPFMFTAPFIYQFGGDIYAEDGMQTAIDSDGSIEGIQFMTDLYTLYSLPLQVPNFYNSFRYNQLPIGISNFETYVQLTAAAPEIQNSWEIALHPGIEQEDGTINRASPGSAQGGMIFEKSEMQDEAWEFMKWWLSADTQVDFATNLQTLYGPEYMWHTANLEAFAELPWPEEHKEVVLEQWEHLQEVPKIPGSYMVEREISNAWTGAVFYDSNIRGSVDYSVIIANREIMRKMEEFGYVENGQTVQPYRVPQLETVEEWMRSNDEE